MSTLPDYIDWVGEHSFAPPHHLTGSEIFGFTLRADRKKLQELCNKCINSVSTDVDYQPLNFVLMLFHRVDALIPHGSKVAMKEKGEVLFFVPVIKWRKLCANFWLPEDICLFIPYIFVNSSPALISGREVYGYPKQWGKIKFYDVDEDRDGKAGENEMFTLNAFVWPQEDGRVDETKRLLTVHWPDQLIAKGMQENFKESLQQKELPEGVLRIDKPETDDLKEEIKKFSKSLRENFEGSDIDDLRQLLREKGLGIEDLELPSWIILADRLAATAAKFPRIHEAIEWLDSLIDPLLDLLINTFTLRLLNFSFTNVFLKQFRDANEPTKACYQAIIEADYSDIKFHNRTIFCDLPLTRADVYIEYMESHPIAQDLGLLPINRNPKDSPQQHFKATLWIFMELDFKLGKGKAVWESTRSSCADSWNWFCGLFK
ncbi:MAG: acetoacetate decarboxylase family protein [Cyanobacteria bacterium P01_G01_bin.54]